MSLYNIFHVYDTDGGFGDAVPQKKFVALVAATEKEIQDFLSIWNKPRIYDRPYSVLEEHCVVAEKVETQELSGVVPYDPKTRDWPDLPEDLYWGAEYDPETNTWKE